MKPATGIWLLFVIFIMFANVHPKIWIVDNNPNSAAGDFTTLTEAHAAAADGDTVFVYPSDITYAGIAVTKRLFFWGVGFNLDIYGGLASEAASTIGNMRFDPGSEGSVLQGFAGNFYVYVNAADITIKRNDLRNIKINKSSCIVVQNDINGDVNLGSSVYIELPNLGNILIANNKIRNSNAGDHAIYSNTSSNVTIVNNVLEADEAALAHLSATSLVQNNIIVAGKTNTATSAIYQYNMCNGTQLPSGNGNMLNVNMNTVFEDPTNFTTGLHLLPGSPAIGTGYNGTDMGIYGGTAPYIDGGYPGLPAIYHLESEAVTTPQRGLNVLIKAKSNKE